MDYSKRVTRDVSEFLQENFDHIIKHDENAALVIQSNAAYFGAVFLTNEGAAAIADADQSGGIPAWASHGFHT